jgi:hypothetical protein
LLGSEIMVLQSGTTVSAAVATVVAHWLSKVLILEDFCRVPSIVFFQNDDEPKRSVRCEKGKINIFISLFSTFPILLC